MGVIFKGDSLVGIATTKDQTAGVLSPAGARDFYLLQGIQTASGLLQNSNGCRVPCARGV
jgi:hypothetical protein